MQKTLLFALAVCMYQLLPAQGNFVATKGILDLSNTGNALASPIPLKGEWEFCRQAFDHECTANNRGLITVPGGWQNNSESFLTRSFGVGTYRITILLPEAGGMWALHIPPIHSAYRLFVNGRLIDSMGLVAKDHHMIPGIRTGVIYFEAPQKKVSIAFEVSNFNFVAGGMVKAPYFGRPGVVNSNRNEKIILSAFLIGALIIMCIYHFCLFFLRPKDRAFLYFALICLFIAVRESFASEALFYMLFPSAGYDWSVKLLYATFPVSLCAFTFFFANLYPDFSRLLKWSSFWLGLFYSLAVLLAPNVLYANLLWLISIFFFIQAMYAIGIVCKRFSEDRLVNGLFLIGVVVLLLTMINDVLFDAQVINSFYAIPLGFFSFTVLQTAMLSIRFTKAFYHSESLKVQLLSSKIAFEEMQANMKQEILKSQLETHEETLRNVSEEIHDNIGAKLTLVKLELLKCNVPGNHQLNGEIQDIRKLVAEAIQDLRSLAKSLHGDTIGKLGLYGAIELQLHQIRKATDLQIDYVLEGIPRSINDKIEIVLFRIVQEALNNIIKHAEATLIHVEIKYSVNCLSVTIRDNGEGFEPSSTTGTGIGLNSMYNRAEILGGSLAINSQSGNGTVVVLTYPIMEAVAAQSELDL